ncbi:MAG: YccF domain-containing protein [Clostridia bacterium]|nr:YccF domain-containing protein [Clostridia bacterium]
MKTIGNILWLLFTGLWAGLAYFFIGIIWCITIIGIPFGKQCFKFAKLSFWPFGTEIKSNFGSHPIANVLWIIFGGLELAIGFLIIGAVWCITIIGIPFGKQCFKFAKLSIAPFGATVG